jgi:hypothetical protein
MKRAKKRSRRKKEEIREGRERTKRYLEHFHCGPLRCYQLKVLCCSMIGLLYEMFIPDSL